MQCCSMSMRPVQAAQNMALAAQAAAQAAAAQLQGAEAQVRSCRRRTHDAEAAIAAKGEALEEATLTNHHLQVQTSSFQAVSVLHRYPMSVLESPCMHVRMAQIDRASAELPSVCACKCAH